MLWELDPEDMEVRLSPLLLAIPPFSKHKKDKLFIPAMIHIGLVLDPTSPFYQSDKSTRVLKADNAIFPPTSKLKKPTYYKELYDAYEEERITNSRANRTLQALQATQDRLIDYYRTANVDNPDLEEVHGKFVDQKTATSFMTGASNALQELIGMEKSVHKQEFRDVKSIAGRDINPLERI